MTSAVGSRCGASILALATGPDQDEARLRALLEPLDGVSMFAFDRARKATSALALLKTIARERPELVVMEGTGAGGGVPLLLARALLGVRYVVASGDAVGPFLGMTNPLLGLPGWLYESLLVRFSSAYIGWTPYLVGRAITLGARRAVTAPGWAAHGPSQGGRERVRRELGISDRQIVFGIAGSVVWIDRVGYSYGVELVRAITTIDRADVVVVVVGDGSGLSRLEAMAGRDLGARVKLVGRVPREQVPDYLAAFDVASLPQSLDQVGAFRYTTKLPEYLGARLPIVTGRLPLAYDLALDWSWRLPGTTPWSETYVSALAELMVTITHEQIAARRPASMDPRTDGIIFQLGPQQDRVGAMLRELLSEGR
jgi:hypothetical protein